MSNIIRLTSGQHHLILCESHTDVTHTDHTTATLGGLNLLTGTWGEEIREVVVRLLLEVFRGARDALLVECHILIEIGTQDGMLELRSELRVILMRIEGYNLEADHARNILNLLSSLIKHRGGELRMNNPADVGFIVIAVHSHNVIHQLE